MSKPEKFDSFIEFEDDTNMRRSSLRFVKTWHQELTRKTGIISA